MAKRLKANEPVILAVDEGTTGTKALLLSSRLQVLGEASREFPQHFPRPGWVEHDVEEIFACVRQAVREVLLRTGLRPQRIAAIGITNQRETTVLWDHPGGRPIHRAIVWQDRRTAPQCQALRRRGLEDRYRRRTGLVLDPYFSGTKIVWLLDNVRGARRAAESGRLRFGTIDTYLTWRLSGGAAHVTDPSNASRTLLMDLATCRFSRELLEPLGIPAAILPEIRPNDAVFGETRGLDFLPDGIPIASLIGDQQAALFGQACFAAGEAKCTYGTGAFVLLNTGKRIPRSRAGLLSTALWQLRGETWYGLEGSTFIAGAVVQWLRDGLGIIRSSGEVEKLASSVPDAGGVVLVPALTGLGAPHWAPGARGLICGLTRGSTAAHLARAALDGMAFQIHDLVRAMERDTRRPLRALKVDGGASRNDLLLQLQADVLRTRIIRPEITSTTALGAALLAGLSIGIFPSLAAIAKVWREERSFRPRLAPGAARERLDRWERAVTCARGLDG